MKDQELEQLTMSSRRGAIVSIGGITIMILSVLYSYFKLASTEKTVQEKQKEINSQLQTIGTLTDKVKSLRNTQDSLLDFLAKVTDESQLSILDPDVDWNVVKSNIEKLPYGKRKQAVLTAILLAWKEIPFSLGQQSLSKGFDSPRFIAYVLSKNGVKVTPMPNERLSDTLMRTFEKVENPSPGDLVFYKGQVGSFGFIYLGDGKPSGAGIGIGTLQASAPLQVMSLDNVNTRYFPLIGYFSVRYPDEIRQARGC